MASATFEYPLSSPRPGWSEQDPEDWWQASARSVRKVLKDGKIKPASGAGIGLSGQMHGSVFLDKNHQVIRPPCCGTTSEPQPNATRSNAGPAADAS
ncbi:MAG: hypothetical protein CM1200mP2_53210 [Planctomycetaceae bacterium]|nr:MAG: hypothetical protein CM1200mP2_53210 [Planctomycetaceae bacterium]